MAFLNLPTEILVQVLCHLPSSLDIAALNLSCKQLYGIWKTHSGSILWHVGMGNIICFDDALMAVSHDTTSPSFLMSILSIPGTGNRDCESSESCGGTSASPIPLTGIEWSVQAPYDI
jgi:hypothetical protein